MDDDISSTENDEPPGSGWIFKHPTEVYTNVVSPSDNLLRQFPPQTLNRAKHRSAYTRKHTFHITSDVLSNSCASNLPAFPSGERSIRFREELFPDVSDREWNNWHWQLANRIKDLAGLERIILLSENFISKIFKIEYS